MANATDNAFYRFSVGYLNQDGVIVGSNVERVTLGATYRQNFFNDRLGIRINSKLSRSADQFTPGGVLGNAAEMAPTQPIYGIVDLNLAVKPALNVVDATEFIVSNGPFGPGQIFCPQKVVVGTDRVAIDAYCAALWGL